MSTRVIAALGPLVSPTGWISQCLTAEQTPAIDVFTSDGGQRDPSAALTATQLWEAFEPYVVECNRRSPNACIAPVLIHMENGFTLSHTSLQDLAQQLGQNRAEFTRVHQWLSGDIACEPIPPSG